jgi:dienelactone hydrolase
VLPHAVKIPQTAPAPRHNGDVERRFGALVTAVAIALLAVPACSVNRPAAPGAGTTPSATPAPASTAAAASSEGTAQSSGSVRTLVTPPAGTAPTGAFAVLERHVRFSRGPDRPLPTTVWYPDAPGPFPLVLFSHGVTSEPSAYASLLTAWARAGFVVAAPAYPHTAYGVADYDPVDVINQPLDASYVITRMLTLNTKPGDPLRGRINPARIAAAGHSAGGITTIGMFTGNRDDRLVAGIVLAGRELFTVPFSGPPAALLFVHGKLDRSVSYASGLAAFQSVPWSRAMMAVTKGGHVAITKDFGPVIATTTDFLRWSLYGDAAARGRLRSDATRGGMATWMDQL